MNDRLSILPRELKVDLAGNNAAFLWGPRKVGKTTLLHSQFPNAKFYDLLNTDLKTRLLLRPAILREEILARHHDLVIVDEIQKVPALLDEIHWCLENTKTKFILCGSSARKLRKEASNLLGGRAWRFELFPLTTNEIEDPEIQRVVNHGLIPRHYLEPKPERSLDSYVAHYLEQEINAEALTRNVPAFGRFLHAVAMSHGQLINYSNIARDCGVASKTVRAYFQILQDTLLGQTLEPWRRSKNRRLIETAKFYLFDPGLVRALKGMHRLAPGTREFEWAFEHFLIQEVRAYISYREKSTPMAFWRTSTGLEVDLILGDMEVAIEFKATSRADERHVKDLLALREDQRVGKSLLVSLDSQVRKLSTGIDVLPWQEFCARLWKGALL